MMKEQTVPRTHESIVQMLPDIIYKLDAEGCFTYINNSIRNLGYEPGDLIYKHFSILIHPEDLDDVWREVAVGKASVEKSSGPSPKLFDERRTGKRITRDLKVRLIPKNYDYVEDRNEDVVASCRVIAVGSYDLRPTGLEREFNGTLGIIKDMSNIKKSRETLIRCIDYYQSLVEISNDIFFVIATDGTVLFTSPSLLRILGYGSNEVAGDNIIGYIHEEDFKNVIRRYCASRHEEPVFNVQCRIRHRDGEWRMFEARGKTVCDSFGRSMYVTVITHDITKSSETEDKLKKVHSELEQRIEDRTRALADANEQLKKEIETRSRQDTIILDSEKKYRNLVNTIDDIVLNIDPEGSILFVNPAVERITGYTQEEVIGRNILELIHRDDIDGFLYSLRSSSEENSGDTTRLIGTLCKDNELRMIRKDGSNIWIEIRCRSVEDTDGNIIGYRGIAHDITRRKQTEEELVRKSKIESLGVLAAGIAHDFNNLLTAIIGNLSLAKVNIPADDDTYGILTDAENASAMAKELTQQLMAFSKGGFPEKKITAIKDLLVDTSYFVLRGSSVLCEFDIPDSLWDANIDRGQIGQVFHNIMLNARQSMSEDGGTITVSAENAVVEQDDGLPLKPGKYIKISIADQGSGISEEIISKIFDPYFSTKETGSGLGLAISYSIIKKHDGHITVQSKKRAGTTFYIFLPASHRKAVLQLDASPGKTSSGGRILLMDDEKIILDLGKKLLVHLGYEVVTAMNGSEAVDLVKKARNEGKPFNLVMLDLIVPGGTGADKAIDALLGIDPGIKVIVTSGYADDPVMINCKKYGFSGALTKPFSLEELESELSRVLQQ
jgi:PAS domain S-box-containing protein